MCRRSNAGAVDCGRGALAQRRKAHELQHAVAQAVREPGADLGAQVRAQGYSRLNLFSALEVDSQGVRVVVALSGLEPVIAHRRLGEGQGSHSLAPNVASKADRSRSGLRCLAMA